MTLLEIKVPKKFAGSGTSVVYVAETKRQCGMKVEQEMQAGYTGREREAVARDSELLTVPFFVRRTKNRMVTSTTFCALYGDWM